ncbi:MAG: YraN family protein [Alphaproteobacteria bacterium]|nr:YraN family protein [Alphaproteobacteria bacterium]
MNQAKRQQAFQRGHKAETLCVWFLRLKGYRIHARRFRTPLGEIDIIAKRRKVLIFIEVKARNDLSTGIFAVTSHQQKRISKAALFYLSYQPNMHNNICRFDVMVVRPWRWPYHMQNAWQLK